MECELCGRSSQLIKIEIEGALLSVCSGCSRLGQRTEMRYDMPDRPRVKIDNTQIREDFARIIKESRIAAGIDVQMLGTKISEKATIIDRIEKGMRPTNDVAKKLEKALKIKLLGLEEIEIETSKISNFSQSLGDVATIKTKKKAH